MNSIRRRASYVALFFALTIGASDAQQIPGYGAVHPVVIQKDKRGLLSDEAARQLSEVMEEIAEHGVLRVWAEANIRCTHRVPTDPAYASQMRRIRALQHRIVAKL